MQTVSRSSFTTVTTEGAILPADLLQRIVYGRELDGLRPEDYHLAPSERLNEAISRSWNRLLGVWEGFNEQRVDLPEEDRGTTLTRERWLLILLQELGYGRLPFQGSLAVDGEDEESANYPISHEYDRAPLNLITFRQPLDRADSERSERFRRSPHSLLQEFLNRSDRHLWGIVCNGLRLRLMRDNVSFTRAAYLEFDLEAMMEGEIYADFTLLWLTVHQSRVEGAPETCWIEKWSQEAAEQGTRALDSLRDGVQEAISILGRGFLAHPANGELRQQLQNGDLNTQDYYRQLLRLVYRLIFLFVAEDRNLLLVKESDAEARELYYSYYSLTRLRELSARRRSGPHPDLYRSLRLVMVLLREGYPALGLPALGSYLFSERSTPGLDAAEIANEALLDAVRGLALTVENRVLRPVDYKNLGAEELGSVYESLLELHPELNVAAATFNLKTAAGSERKTTGSYYTPTSLINSLLDTALEPVVADRLRGKRGKEAEEALLEIKVVDPAAGSGHFLIAAANRLARHLARIRTGDEEPSPEANRLALRDVVRHCIHGVDINEMAVELCKVGLWLETLDPGKPLSFLDANIQCGNSLIGATPALLAEGVPDDAFKPIIGDDKAYCTEWRKRNKEQRKGQLDLLTTGWQPWERLGNLAEAFSQLRALENDTLAGVLQQEEAYTRFVRSTDYEYGRLWADAWCAAFVWHKKPEDKEGFPYPITEQVFRRLKRSPHSEPKWLKDEIRRLAEEYHFFHWHLVFPQVLKSIHTYESSANTRGSIKTGWAGGFDVVLGNPPWERIKLQEKEWFASRNQEIASARNAAERRKLINAMQTEDPLLYASFQSARRKAEGESHIARHSEKYPLCGRGDINTYAIFAELNLALLNQKGRLGNILPSGIFTDHSTKEFFQHLLKIDAVVSFFDFWNRKSIFVGVQSKIKFSLVTLTLQPQTRFTAAAQLEEPMEIHQAERLYNLSAKDVQHINPNTSNCPIFRSNRDADLIREFHKQIPVLIVDGPPERNPLGIEFLRMIDMSNDSNLFRTFEQLSTENFVPAGNVFGRNAQQFLPLYEAKLAHHFNHRSATFERVPEGDRFKTHAWAKTTTSDELKDPYFSIIPRYWIESIHVNARSREKTWFIGFRNAISTVGDARSLVATIIPYAGVGNSMPLIFMDHQDAFAPLLLGNLNSFVLDYVLRQKASGGNLNYYVFKQLPVLSLDRYVLGSAGIIGPRVMELTFTSYDLKTFAEDSGYLGPPFAWDEERRFFLRCELDAVYFHLYSVERDDVAYIMDTFPIVRRRDEDDYGEYRTKSVILEIYDEMAEAMATGQPYQTRIDPPPAHPDAAHPWDEEYLGPELPRDRWWQEVELPEAVESEKPKTTFTSPPTSSTVKEPPPAFEQKPPPSKPAQQKKKSPAQPAQPVLVTDFTPPLGAYAQRLKRVMALGQPKNQVELAELIAALGDENDNIRWLAGSSLAKLGDLAAVNLLAVFLDIGHGDVTREEVIRVLRLIAETAEDETVRKSALAIGNQYTN